MSNVPKSGHAAVGFRVKSGWASAVFLAGPVPSPQVLDHRMIELSDPAVPDTRQPYHADFGTLEEDASKIARRTKIVRRVTARSVIGQIKSYHERGCMICGTGLVVGSQIDPVKPSAFSLAKIRNRNHSR